MVQSLFENRGKVTAIGPAFPRQSIGESKEMADKTKQAGPANPYDSDGFRTGGGLWDDQTVTIVSAKAVVDLFTKKDGSAWLNDKGEQGRQNALSITGIADGQEYERKENYSSGSHVPTPDGEGFVAADGSDKRLHTSSAAAKFFDLIKKGGFDIGKLYDTATGKSRISALVGARFTMKGEPKLDKDGKPKTYKGYVEQQFFPVKFVGYAGNVAASAGGNGLDTAVKAKAVSAIQEVLAANGGSVGRAALLNKLGSVLASDPDSGKIMAAILRPEFHNGQAWKYDGNTLTAVN